MNKLASASASTKNSYEYNFSAGETYYLELWAAGLNPCPNYELQIEYTDSVYRLYNAATSEHLWTTSYDEYKALPTYGWKQEGVAWNCPTSSSIGVYRLYNPGLGTHHYTASKSEADYLVANQGWQYDNDGKPLFYSAGETGDNYAGSFNVYRLYNSDLSQHHYTLDVNEYNTCIDKYNWKGEGVDFYAYEE